MHTDLVQFFCCYMAAYLITGICLLTTSSFAIECHPKAPPLSLGDLDGARFLWRRLPPALKQNQSDIAGLWNIGKVSKCMMPHCLSTPFQPDAKLNSKIGTQHHWSYVAWRVISVLVVARLFSATQLFRNILLWKYQNNYDWRQSKRPPQKSETGIRSILCHISSLIKWNAHAQPWRN